MTHRLPAMLLAPALTLLVTVGLTAGVRHRDISVLAYQPHASASVGAAFGTSREKPAEDEASTLDAAFDAGTPAVRVRTRLRCGTRPADLDGDPGATGPWITPVVTAASDRPPDAVSALLLAAVSGRCSAPSTAPPFRSL